MNTSLINWYSKRQSTIETSAFGSELVAIKVGIKNLSSIQYKMRMMGIPISGASYVYEGNMLVIHNSSKPESTLKKKAIHESVARGETLTGHTRSKWIIQQTC